MISFCISDPLFHGYTVKVTADQVCEHFEEIGTFVGNLFTSQLSALFKQHGLLLLLEKVAALPKMHLHGYTLSDLLDNCGPLHTVYLCTQCIESDPSHSQR